MNQKTETQVINKNALPVALVKNTKAFLQKKY